MRRKVLILSAISLGIVASLACGTDGAPNLETASSTVDSARGGIVETADGAVSLSFPPGALAEDQEITISAEDAGGSTVAGYRLEPAGLQFSQPVTVSVEIDLAELATGDDDQPGIRIPSVGIQSDGEEPEPLDSAVVSVDVDGIATVTAEIEHFSLFRVELTDIVVNLEQVFPKVKQVGDKFDVIGNIAPRSPGVAFSGTGEMSFDGAIAGNFARVEDPAVEPGWVYLGGRASIEEVLSDHTTKVFGVRRGPDSSPGFTRFTRAQGTLDQKMSILSTDASCDRVGAGVYIFDVVGTTTGRTGNTERVNVQLFGVVECVAEIVDQTSSFCDSGIFSCPTDPIVSDRLVCESADLPCFDFVIVDPGLTCEANDLPCKELISQDPDREPVGPVVQVPNFQLPTVTPATATPAPVQGTINALGEGTYEVRFEYQFTGFAPGGGSGCTVRSPSFGRDASITITGGRGAGAVLNNISIHDGNTLYRGEIRLETGDLIVQEGLYTGTLDQGFEQAIAGKNIEKSEDRATLPKLTFSISLPPDCTAIFEVAVGERK